MIICFQSNELQDVINLFVTQKISLSFNNSVVIKTNFSIIPITLVLTFDVVDGELQITISKVQAVGINISGLARSKILSSLPKFNHPVISLKENQGKINLALKGITLQQVSIDDQFLLTGTFLN
jgi:hypothetical protein